MCLRLTTKWHLNPYCFLFEDNHRHSYTLHNFSLKGRESFSRTPFFPPKAGDRFLLLPCSCVGICQSYATPLPTPAPPTDIRWQVYYTKCNPLHSFLAHHQVLKSSTVKKRGTFFDSSPWHSALISCPLTA